MKLKLLIGVLFVVCGLSFIAKNKKTQNQAQIKSSLNNITKSALEEQDSSRLIKRRDMTKVKVTSISKPTTKKDRAFENPLKLPEKLKGKVLLSHKEKEELKQYYTDEKRVSFAIEHLSRFDLEPKGTFGIARIDSIDFLEKSMRYRENRMRAKILKFVEDFTHSQIPGYLSDLSKKFFLGDQIEVLEILAFNQPREFLYLQQRTTNKRVLKMMGLVQHHANRNQ
jgi:hypothetical protein